MRTSLFVAGLVTGALLVASTVHASTITVNFTGSLTDAPANPLGLAVGDTFAGTVIYDLAFAGAVDFDGNASRGQYLQDLFGPIPYPFSVTVAGNAFRMTQLFLVIVDSSTDTYYAEGDPSPGSSFPSILTSADASILLTSSNTAIYASDALTTPFPLAQADVKNLFTLDLRYRDPNSGSITTSRLTGPISSVTVGDPIPEPTSVLLLGSGLLALTKRVRNRRGHQ